MEIMADTCCQAKEMLRKPPGTGMSKYFLALPSQKLRILVGLLTGHTDFSRHLYYRPNESQ